VLSASHTEIKSALEREKEAEIKADFRFPRFPLEGQKI
jgi:hypothetical protein